MPKVNLFTVNRTETVYPERPINWETDFPYVLNKSCGSIELVRDRRRRLTLAEQAERKERKAEQDAAEINAFILGVLSGVGGLSALVAILLHAFGGI